MKCSTRVDICGVRYGMDMISAQIVFFQHWIYSSLKFIAWAVTAFLLHSLLSIAVGLSMSSTPTLPVFYPLISFLQIFHKVPWIRCKIDNEALLKLCSCNIRYKSCQIRPGMESKIEIIAPYGAMDGSTKYSVNIVMNNYSTVVEFMEAKLHTT